MTTNQIKLRDVVETERSNRAKEYETNRSNVARETETHRSNVVNETETHRSNVENETERHRHNVRGEELTAERSEWERNIAIANATTTGFKNVGEGFKSFLKAGDILSGIFGG